MSVLVALDKEAILTELQLANLSAGQKETIWRLILDIFQTRIIERMLSDLELEADRRRFLVLLTASDEQQLRQFLNKKIADVETKLENLIEQIKADLKKDILAAREESQ